MPTYSRPGVYIEETLRPLSDISTDPAESSAAFVGRTSAGGPVGPVFVSSWSQYQSLFGQITNDTADLAYAVYSFFQNGGRGAYVVRALSDDATPADLVIHDGTGTTDTDQVLVVTASAPGSWASSATSTSRVFVSTRSNGLGEGRFDVVVEVGNGNYLVTQEQFLDLSMNPNDPRYVVSVVNSPTVGSKYITLRTPELVLDGYEYVYSTSTPQSPAVVTKVPLTGGTEGTAPVDLVASTQRLGGVDRNLVINVPGAEVDDIGNITSWIEEEGRHFLVVDVPRPVVGETPADSATSIGTFVGALPKSSHVAVYGPWFYVSDPGSRAGALRLTAPGGAVVGQYLRTDASRGVHKAPAGTTTAVVGAVQPVHLYTNVQQDSLAGAHVNLIRTIPGSGVCIWGARTLALGTPDRYIPIRRLLISLKTSLTAITRFAVFENNEESLWALVEDVVDRFLQAHYDQGAFKGSTQSEAFYVRCDDVNNTPASVETGIINIEVGVALNTPAEFIVIRLGQQQSGAVATDDLEVN